MPTTDIISSVRASTDAKTCSADVTSDMASAGILASSSALARSASVAILVPGLLRDWNPALAVQTVTTANLKPESQRSLGAYFHQSVPGASAADVLAMSDMAAKEAATQAAELARSMSLKVNTISTKDMPQELINDKVFQALTQAAQAAASQAQRDISLRAALPAALSVSPTESPGGLSNGDFKKFAETLRHSMVSAPLAYGSDHTLAGTPPKNMTTESRPPFSKAFVFYFSQYYKGKFVDRMGNKLAKPTLSRTIGNTDIAGAVEVMWELILDYKFSTPIWKDANSHYYPGNSSDAPTALDAGLVTAITMLDPKDSEHCGITPLKAEAIEYLANTASDSASSLGGLVGGSFGGLHFGLGVMGKVSIGDNQTLQTLVKTSLARTASRAAEEASYRALYWIRYPYDPKSTVADIVQQFLDEKTASK